jgi:YbbR domain-containing protein
MRDVLTKNLGTLLLALALAVAVWALANAEQNPEVTGAFASGIPVEVTGLPQGLVVYGAGPEKVTVKLSAPQDVWTRLRASTFHAYVDLAASQAGVQEFDVKVECSDPRVRLVGKDPAQISLRLEPLHQRMIPVRIRALDEAPSGYNMRGPLATPAQVTINGPAPLVDVVSEAYVEIRVEGSKVSFSKSFQPVLRDVQGKEIKDVAMTPTSVEVQVPIDRLNNFKTVSLKAVITGTVAPGYWITGIVVQPAAVTFGGDPAILEGFGYVETAPVNVTGAVTEVLKSVDIFVPPGTALDKKQEVFVKVSVEPIPGGQIVRRAVTVRNVTRGITVTLVSPAAVDLQLDGSVPDLQSIRTTDISASVDVTGLLTGTYTLPIGVTGVPTSTRLLSVIPLRAGVTLK